MPERLQLKLIENASKNETTIPCEFSDDEWKTLQMFAHEASLASNTRLVRNGQWGSGGIQYEEGIGYSCTASLPDWDEVKLFLHKFRPIILQDERTSFHTVRSFIGRALPHPLIKSFLRTQKDHYTGKVFQSQIRVELGGIKPIDDVIVNSELVLQAYLNSYENHRDEKKKDFIDGLNEILPVDFVKVLHLNLLGDKWIAASNLAALINLMMGRIPDGLEIIDGWKVFKV